MRSISLCILSILQNGIRRIFFSRTLFNSELAQLIANELCFLLQMQAWTEWWKVLSNGCALQKGALSVYSFIYWPLKCFESETRMYPDQLVTQAHVRSNLELYFPWFRRRFILQHSTVNQSFLLLFYIILQFEFESLFMNIWSEFFPLMILLHQREVP